VFITTEGQTRESIISMFESVVLTPDEAAVLQALHTIEPGIERIASIGTQGRVSARDARGGIAMMVAGQRIPMVRWATGIWRLLGIALALVRARGGVLLVDEIDTGLHYSVLVDMWKLVFETARSLDVQVFATTHSRDCYEALAAVAEPGRTEISLQRIVLDASICDVIAGTALSADTCRHCGKAGCDERAASKGDGCPKRPIPDGVLGQSHGPVGIRTLEPQPIEMGRRWFAAFAAN
jgi:hypothetical protein